MQGHPLPCPPLPPAPDPSPLTWGPAHDIQKPSPSDFPSRWPASLSSFPQGSRVSSSPTLRTRFDLYGVCLYHVHGPTRHCHGDSIPHWISWSVPHPQFIRCPGRHSLSPPWPPVFSLRYWIPSCSGSLSGGQQRSPASPLPSLGEPSGLMALNRSCLHWQLQPTPFMR